MNRVLIVEDDPMARRLLEMYVESCDKFELVKSIDNADLAYLVCEMNELNLILMDVCTAGHASGLDAAEKIKKRFPSIRIIIITSQPECSFLDRAQSIGVDSFWYKDSDPDELLEVMKKTVEGTHVYPDSTPVLQIGKALSSDFTERELEVLRELIKGDPDQVIADHLYMSLRTVKAHIQSLREKTGYRNRTELAVRARESGLMMNDNEG